MLVASDGRACDGARLVSSRRANDLWMIAGCHVDRACREQRNYPHASGLRAAKRPCGPVRLCQRQTTATGLTAAVTATSPTSACLGRSAAAVHAAVSLPTWAAVMPEKRKVGRIAPTYLIRARMRVRTSSARIGLCWSAPESASRHSRVHRAPWEATCGAPGPQSRSPQRSASASWTYLDCPTEIRLRSG